MSLLEYDQWHKLDDICVFKKTVFSCLCIFWGSYDTTDVIGQFEKDHTHHLPFLGLPTQEDKVSEFAINFLR